MDDHELIRRALDRVAGKSQREAGAALGVSHVAIGNWRRAIEAGTRLETDADTRSKLFLALSGGGASADYWRGVALMAHAQARAMADALGVALVSPPSGAADAEHERVTRAAAAAAKAAPLARGAGS